MSGMTFAATTGSRHARAVHAANQRLKDFDMRFPLLRTLTSLPLVFGMAMSHAGQDARSHTEAKGGANAEGRISASAPSGGASAASATQRRHGTQEGAPGGRAGATGTNASGDGRSPGASSGTNNPAAGQTGAPKGAFYPGQSGGAQRAKEDEGQRR